MQVHLYVSDAFLPRTGLLTPFSICRILRLAPGVPVFRECTIRALLPRFPHLSKDVIELIGVVEECYPNTTFRVRITSDEAKGHQLLCHLAGRMRVNKVRILPGDRVRVEMTPYDLEKGRIVYRFRADDPAGNPASRPPTPAAPLTPPPSPIAPASTPAA